MGKAAVAEAHSRGLTVAEIATELGISRRTVRNYLCRLDLRAHRAPDNGWVARRAAQHAPPEVPDAG